MKRAFLRCEETPSLFANSSIYSPLHSERGWGGGFLSAPSIPLFLCLTASEASNLVVLLFLHSAVDLSEPVAVCEDKG